MKMLVAVAVILAGCATVGNPELARDDLIAQVRVGESTRDDVKALLGQPSQMMQLPRVEGHGAEAIVHDEELWTYMRYTMRARPETFIPLVGPFVGGWDSEHRTLTVRFDQYGIVRWVGYGRTPGVTGPPAAKD